MNPVKGSLKYPQATLVLTFMLFVVGVHALLTMPRREDPKITIRVGLVAAIYPGASAEQVEEQVTRKIEDRLFRFEEVRKAKTFSTSRDNAVIVNVQLEDRVTDTDKFWSKLRHEMNVLGATELPKSVQGPVVDSDFGDTVAILLVIRGQRYGFRELKDYARRIEDELRSIRAVSKIKRVGEQKEEILLTSSSEKLSQYSVQPLRIIQALQTRNVVQFAGNLDTQASHVPLKTDSLFATEDEIRKVMIDMSPTGQPVYIGDLADVERRYRDPSFLTRLNGEPALMLSVEMQEGNNIVDFGNDLRKKIAEAKASLPPDLQLDLLADQPKVVEERISDFIREFGIAILSVILVTAVLLPFRVALIAALAIPVTVAVTFATLNAFGIELHQVSISALIVVLGMVVDDAIVIADNYVELLDRKVPREEAAWRCASELAVPVLTATLTIIASFLPLLMLSGSVGEFISSLPIAVTIALSSSYIVAMVLTPLLNRFFIKQGLHSHDEEEKPKRFDPLGLMQRMYNRTIEIFMARKPLAVSVGVAAVIAGVVLLRIVPEQFFPSAERNQFVIDVWMPEGTRIEATEAVLTRLEGALKKEPLIVEYATFLGGSAPRFYYNVNPEPPANNYGQLLINTKDAHETPLLVASLRQRLAQVAPEARVIVKELQQGELLPAPIEVRISGEDLAALKGLGSQVESALRESPGSTYVHHDFREDSMRLHVNVNTEVSNRLGLSNASIANQLAGGFDGIPVTTFWEGERAVDVVLRLEPGKRQSFDDIRNGYVTSIVTGAKVPLREVADLDPGWETSRIVRRNGIRTLTVRSFHDEHHLASAVLKEAVPKIRALRIPAGYHIEFGGEIESQEATFQEMVRALVVSLIAIFLILLFQFRSITEPLVVMSSIPLALLGASAGLVLTRNPFGFTAFMGVVSLSGVVVRNAIILVDYINGRRKQGARIEEAALEAGERRLRPIFLTTMAAAVGVTPMILSGSSLWSPLASVIAIGLIVSMFFTLLVVPVLYVLIEGRKSASPAELEVAQ